MPREAWDPWNKLSQESVDQLRQLKREGDWAKHGPELLKACKYAVRFLDRQIHDIAYVNRIIDICEKIEND